MQVVGVHANVMQHIAVILHDTLRLARGTGSVKDVSEPVGLNCRQINWQLSRS